MKPTKTTLALSKAKRNYYTTLIGDQQNNPRMLFSTINRLLSPLDVPQLSGAPDLCFKLLDLFQENMAIIHQQLLASATNLPHAPLAQIADPPTVRLPQCSLSSFSPVDSISVAKLVSQAKASTCSLDHMPTTLHWLPVKSCITYKILLLTYKALHSIAPQCLSDLLHPYTQSRTLCSAGTHQLSIPHTKLQTFGDGAFCVTAPTLWNTLPAEIRT